MLGNFIFWRKITKSLKNVKETLKKPQKTKKKIEWMVLQKYCQPHRSFYWTLLVPLPDWGLVVYTTWI